MAATVWAPGTTPNTNTNTTRVVEEFEATAGQTQFDLTLFTYSPGTQSLEVYRDGLLVSVSEVAEDSSGTFFTLPPVDLGALVIAVGLVGIVGSPSIPADGSITTSKLAVGLVVPVNKGGTGAVDAATARTNLAITPTNIGALATTAIGVTVQGYDPDTVKRDVQNTFTAQQIPFSGTLTDAPSIDWDADVNGQVVSIIIAGDRTVNAPTNVEINATYLMRITQDATGGRVLSWNVAFKFGPALAPVLSTAGNSVDWLSFIGAAGNTMEFTGIRKAAVI
jgi:hypothetical protein